MKRYQLLFWWLFCCLFLSACSDNENVLTDEEKAVILLTKTWTTGTIKLDGVDITEFGYQNFEIDFEDNGTWSAKNGGDIFGNSGTWQFTNAQFTAIRLSGVDALLNLNP